MFQRSKRWKYSIVISCFLLNVEIWFNFTTSNLLLYKNMTRNLMFTIFFFTYFQYDWKTFLDKDKLCSCVPNLKLCHYYIGNWKYLSSWTSFKPLSTAVIFFNHLFFWCSIFFKFIPLFLHINWATPGTYLSVIFFSI